MITRTQPERPAVLRADRWYTREDILSFDTPRVDEKTWLDLVGHGIPILNSGGLEQVFGEELQKYLIAI